ncbi:hypothetical protein SDC9_129345 [bioreactor metagenome]|uniref:SH3b domain-containing protein n=1 Tax=bioreactor metagenome TaxID=1076179 RepID=A0A645CZ87_9ZZZZ
MKKIISIVLALTILLGASSAAYAAKDKVMYATEPVYMRSGPGTKYAIITELITGDALLWLGKSGSWAKVSLDGQTGYVYGKYLSKERITLNALITAKRNVTVRSGPGTNYKKLGQMEPLDTAKVISVSGKWLKITWNDQTAYVYKSYFYIENVSFWTLDVSEIQAFQKYYDENKDIYLGNFTGRTGDFTIRIINGANKSKVENDLRKIVPGYPYFKVVQSALPAHVDKAYIDNILQEIASHVRALTKAQREQCSIAWASYNVAEDVIQVGIVKLTDKKTALFRQWISDSPYIEFISEKAYEMPVEW